MPPYERKCLQRIFDTIGLSDTTLVDMIKDWLLDAIVDTRFNHYDYTIMVGHDLFNHGISRIFNDPKFGLFHILDKSRIKMQFCADPLWDSGIKIEWQVPVYRDDGLVYRANGLRIGKMYIDEHFDAYKNVNRLPQIKKVIYNNPATIIFWADGTKTVVQCQEGDSYDPEKGLTMAISKKALGNTSRKLNDVLHKWEKKEEPSIPHSCVSCKYGDQGVDKKPCNSCDASFGNWEAEE